MGNKSIVATISAIAALSGSGSLNNAYACFNENGCVIESLHNDYHMKREGRMEKAISAGRSNMDAFRALQREQEARGKKR